MLLQFVKVPKAKRKLVWVGSIIESIILFS
jgi:hypothetical protein